MTLIEDDRLRRYVAGVARDVQIAQDEADRARRQRRREEWPEERAKRMQAWVQHKRAAEEAGRPVLLPDPPPEEPGEDWYRDDPSPRTIIPAPEMPTGPDDLLGRPTETLLTPEESLKQQAKAAKKGLLRR